MAIASLVFGLVCCFPSSVMAVIAGSVALQQIDASGGTMGGRGLARAGQVLGLVGLGLNALGLLATLLG